MTNTINKDNTLIQNFEESQSPLSLYSIKKVLNENYKFFVPAYQRGYRWRPDEIKQLMDDLNRFREEEDLKSQAERCPFYCLQAVVVKETNNGLLEVIDGQQRLTTTLILLQALYTVKEMKPLIRDMRDFLRGDKIEDEWTIEKRYSIQYATRGSSDKWLKEITIAFLQDLINKNNYECEKLKDYNSDYYHFVEAYKTAIEIFSNKSDKWRMDFDEVLQERTCYIWYNTSIAETKDKEVDIFDRINATKIDLNNAELIKALELQDGNYSDNIVKRDQLAIDWDQIEKELQDPSFWGFIYSTKHPFSYATHIEYLFDLLQCKTEVNQDFYYYTFNKYYEQFLDNQNQRFQFVEKCWNDVQNMMLTLKEWYADKTCYHYVGYLLEYGKEMNSDKNITILYLVKLLDGISKKDRKEKLKSLIKYSLRKLTCTQLFHSSGSMVTQVLFLLNIQTEENRKSNTARFSFSNYKDIKKQPGWNEEHVASNTDYVPEFEHKDELAYAILEYFTGIANEDNFEKYSKAIINNMPNDKEEEKLCKELLKFFTYTDSKDENTVLSIKKVYNKVLDFFHTNDDAFKDSVNINNSNNCKNEKDFIWNFALLNATTNKSYSNDIYPLKRRRIMTDEDCIYTPVCTRAMFEKAYSHKLSNLMAWTRTDGKNFWDYICDCLSDFLPANLQLPFNY